MSADAPPPPGPRWRMILGREAGLAIAFILVFFPCNDFHAPALESLQTSGAAVVDLVGNEQSALGGSSTSKIEWKRSASSRVRLLALASVASASLALLLAPRKRTPRVACGVTIVGAAGIASIMLGQLRTRSTPRPFSTWRPLLARGPDATTVLVEAAPFLFALLPLVALLLRKRWSRWPILAFAPLLAVLSFITLPSRSWLGDDFAQWGPRAVSALLAIALVVEGTAPDLLRDPTTDPAD